MVWSIMIVCLVILVVEIFFGYLDLKGDGLKSTFITLICVAALLLVSLGSLTYILNTELVRLTESRSNSLGENIESIQMGSED